MDDPVAMLRPSLARRLLAARGILGFERAHAAFWPAAAVVGVFVATAWFDLLVPLPALLHALLLVGFAVALALAMRRGWRESERPSADAGLARLERDSGLRHETLRAIDDTLPPGAAADPMTQALWAAHRERLGRQLGRLSLGWPQSDLPRRDPWALRALLTLVLALALADARGDWVGRLGSAVSPAFAATPVVPPTVDLWLTPPGYTRQAPLGAAQTRTLDRVSVPAGTQALLQLQHLPETDGPRATATLDGQPVVVLPLGEAGAEARFAVERPGLLELRDAGGRPLKQWSIETVADQLPTVAFTAPPAPTARAGLEVAYTAADDHGVREVLLELLPEGPDATLLTRPLARPAGQPTTLASRSFQDFSAHPAAGSKATMTLTAMDAAGQQGRSAPLELVLPERPFRHPLARAIIAERKRLWATPGDSAAIAEATQVLAGSPPVAALAPSVALGLGVAAQVLADATDAAGRDKAQALLWDVALFVEEGDLASAERELRALEEQLRQSLQDQTSDAELERQMQALEEALERFLDEMQRQAEDALATMTPEQRQQLAEQAGRQDPSTTVDRQDLQEMLDKARELMRGGAREQAEQALARLQQMLENLQSQMAMPQAPGPAEQALSDLEKMLQMQRQLLDRSFAMDQQAGSPPGQPPPQRRPGERGEQGQGQPPDSPQRAAAEQDALRKALGELMRRMGEAGMEIPRELGQAEMQMRGARDQLGQGQPGNAQPPQASALDLMQQGGQAMAQAMQQGQDGQAMGEGGPGQGAMPRPGRRGRDPFGRAQVNGGGNDPEGETVPDQGELGRARDLLQELYRRSGEQTRPRQELDYYGRLLDRF